MLRASIEFHGTDGDVRAVTEGEKLGDAGIEHGERLMTFARRAVNLHFRVAGRRSRKAREVSVS